MAINEAQKAKAEKYLNSFIRHNGMVMTVKNWLNTLKDEGYKPYIESIRDESKEEKEKARLNALYRSWDFPFGNPNHPMVIKYNQDKAELEKGFYKTVYVMRTESTSYVITKTAYDYLMGENQDQES